MGRKLVRKDEDSSPVTHAIKAERAFHPIPTGMTLVEGSRADLPDDPDPPKGLVFLVQEAQALYMTFMGRLMSGASFRSAAMATGQYPGTIGRWLQKGAGDMINGEDTYCGRFLQDCQRAAALAVSSAEERVFASDPAKWLGKGPAKDFHKGRYWTDDPTNIEELHNENPLDPIPEHSITDDEQKQIEEADRELSEALKILQNHQIVNNPEFIQQAQDQFRFLNDEENQV